MDEKEILKLKMDILALVDKAVRDAKFRGTLPPKVDYANWSDKHIWSPFANITNVCGMVHHGKWEDRTAADREFLRGLAISAD